MMQSNFQNNMIAFEAIREIVRINPEISCIFFAVYIPAKYFPPVDDKIFRRNPLSDEPIPMERETLLKISYEEFSYMQSQDATENQHLGFLSKVKLRDGETAYLPLMDFSSKAGNCLEAIKKFLTDIGQSGVILASGRSYHYYRSHPTSKSNWLAFLGYSMLAKYPEYGYIADRRYIGHSLIDECSMLRISTSEVHPHMPIIVAVI